MARFPLLPLIGSLSLLLGACSTNTQQVDTTAVQATEITSAPAQQQGSALLMPFKKQLKSALVTGMQQGPDQAVAACNEQAPTIAQSLSIDGVSVGRSSHRLRNDNNAPTPWLAPILDEYVNNPNLKPKTLALTNGLNAYVEPIVMQPMCATCHGESIAPAIAERIHTLYPKDQATGFKAGELRGVFWTVFPAEQAD